MAVRLSLCFVFVVLVCSVLAAMAQDDMKDDGPCSAGVDTVRLTGSQTNETCSTVEGRVQVCEGEEGGWRNLCDGNWTVQDAAVTCRSFNYSNQNAQNRQGRQIVSGSSHYGVRCNGSEETFADCDRSMENMGQRCGFTFFVVCYLTDEAAEEQLCEPPISELTTDPLPLPTTTSSINTGVPTTFGTSSPTPTDALVTMDATSQTSPPEATDSTGLLTAPTLYYFIGGLSAIIVAAILLVVVFLLTCCCCCKRRKEVSPTGQQEKGNGQLRSIGDSVESHKSKDHVTAQYQLQQSSQPIYEAIPNENSSTHSQESPSLKPLRSTGTELLRSTGSELYASLDQNNTYAELKPHISSPRSASISSPNADSYYQQLDHRTGSRTGSMKRELPSIPIQAMNPTALAIDKGEVEERGLSAQADVFVGGSSTSLPANTGHFQQAPNGSVQRPHLEQVNLKELLENGMASGDQTNIYNILDQLPDYSTLEQIDEVSQVSTTAVCNNGVAQGRHGSRSKEHSPRSSHHSQERFPEHIRSTTLPSNSHSPRSSRTSSLSSNNSPHIHRSPPTGRATTTSHKIGNKYSDDPTASPRIIPVNRHSGQSSGSEIIDTLV